MNLSEIVWPVYLIGRSEKPREACGVLYYSNISVNAFDESDAKLVHKIIDDKNLPGETLGLRRLRIPSNKLYKLYNAVYFMVDLIKVGRPSQWLIDSTGKLFRYKKTRSTTLICRKITKVLKLPLTGYVIEVEGMHTRFKCIHPPAAEAKYAGLIRWEDTYLLYGFYIDEFKSHNRIRV